MEFSIKQASDGHKIWHLVFLKNGTMPYVRVKDFGGELVNELDQGTFTTFDGDMYVPFSTIENAPSSFIRDYYVRNKEFFYSCSKGGDNEIAILMEQIDTNEPPHKHYHSLKASERRLLLKGLLSKGFTYEQLEKEIDNFNKYAINRDIVSFGFKTTITVKGIF